MAVTDHDPEASTPPSSRFSTFQHRSIGSSGAMDFDGYLPERSSKNVRFSYLTNNHARKSLPLIASPVQQDLHEAVGRGESPSLDRLKSRPQSVDASSIITATTNPQIYRKQHEASTIELFYDLFFVANLAYFTAVYQHFDADSVLNYLKLFTLLWFTWLSTILYDVRFSMDSVYNRVCKLVHFGVMAAFVYAGPVFDTSKKYDDQRYYQAFALVLFVSRLGTAIQYSVVIFHSRRIKRTIVPLVLTTLVYFVASVGYLITRFAFKNNKGPITTIAMAVWLLLAISEGLLTMLIAMIWRSISFKFTHLVERLGLLSLILMGEGIIGMVKSVACIVKGHKTLSSAEIGTVVSAIILIYLIWILYFDQIDHHRFGTIRQQVWALLHYPLHIAILLTVEGNTSLIVWNSIVQMLKFIWKMQPSPEDAPGTAFATSNAFIKFINESMIAIDTMTTEASWAKTYPWASNITALTDISKNMTFKSDQWNKAVVPILTEMYTSAELFVFLAHKESTDKIMAVMPVITDKAAALKTIYAIFDVVVLYFYVCAGGMLLILAIMYWFGKLHKSKYEFGEIINRVLIGFIIPVVGVVATLHDKSTRGWKFAASNWLIPIILFGFLIVIVLDNIILFIAHVTDGHRKRASRIGYEPSRGGGDDNDDMAELVNTKSSSIYTRPVSYQPYDVDSRPTVLSPESAPGAFRTSSRAPSPVPYGHSRGPSRSNSPGPQAVPVDLIMQNNFRPSHVRTRSAGYAAINVEDNDDGGLLEPERSHRDSITIPHVPRAPSPLGR